MFTVYYGYINIYTLHCVFQPLPTRWGLRGDPYLWQELELRAGAEIVTPALSLGMANAFPTSDPSPVLPFDRAYYF